MTRVTRTAAILAFPIARRRDQVRALAAQMLARPQEQAQKHLEFQLRRKLNTLRKKQVPEDVALREVRCFESAVRAELWRLVLTPPQPNPGDAA
jgi:hypothetical protein